MTAREDQETKAAVAALVWRLRNRGDADDEPFAAEFIAALKARGWRPVIERGPNWRLRPGGAPPSEAYLEAKRQVLAIGEDGGEDEAAPNRDGVP